MKAKTLRLFVSRIAAIGFGILLLRDPLLLSREDAFLKTDSEARHEAAIGGDKDASEALPVIDFPLLDQVRSLDLIDMELSFPESLKKLEGHRVSLVGFMAPFDNLRNMRDCMIVPSYVGCKFCSPPNLTQVVFVTQGSDDAGRRSYPYIEAACHVTGILRLSLPESDHEGQEQGFIYSLEDAVVTAHRGEAPKRASGHENTPHQLRTPQLTKVSLTDLIQHVADLIGREPLRHIEIESVSAETFADLVRTGLETTFPEATRSARVRAFRLLGLLPEDADWIDTLAEFQLSRRATATDKRGERIYLVDFITDDHPYVRLELVGEIADALTRQHFPRNRTETQADNTKGGLEESDDTRRAHEALRKGFRTMTLYRYARAHGIPPRIWPPPVFADQSRVRRRGKSGIKQAIMSAEFGLWEGIPAYIGAFFMDFLVGDTGPLSGVDPALARPPSTTMELFRPRWYQDAALWRQDPVPSNFADKLMDTPPILTDVLGIGGLVPLLRKWYAVDVAKRFAGGWAGDRWALWQFPDDGSALMLEIRWQDEDSAIRFHEAIPDDSLWHLPPHRNGSTRVLMLRADSTGALDRLTSAVSAGP